MASPERSPPLRILHCPLNVVGQSAAIAAAQRELGADSRCIVIEESGHGVPADACLTRSGDGLLAREIARYRILWQAMRWADVVHFGFGQSTLVPNAFPGFDDLTWRQPWRWPARLYSRLIWLKDLPLLRAMGKTLAVSWQGDDARQHDRSLELFEISIARELGNSYYVPGSDEWKRRSIAAFTRSGAKHYAFNPDLLHVLPETASFLAYSNIDPRSLVPRPPAADSSEPLIFAHAPSHRGAKGTAHVLAAVEQLRAEGLDFRFTLIEKLPHREAMARYAECDVVVDQLLAGWYGGIAVEVMALGKPVIVYLREDDLDFLDPEMRAELPFLRAEPTSIAAAMRQVIAMPRPALHEIGLRSRAFVERWHDPLRLAAKTLADYEKARLGRNGRTASGASR